MKAPAPGKRRRIDEDPQAYARRMANYIRLLEFIVAVLLLSVGIQQSVYPFDYLIILALLLAYPLIAQTIAAYMERKGQRQQETSRILVQVDAVMIGIAMAALHFSLVPAMTLLIIVHANAVTSGGLYIWLMNIFGTVAGAVVRQSGARLSYPASRPDADDAESDVDARTRSVCRRHRISDPHPDPGAADRAGAHRAAAESRRWSYRGSWPSTCPRRYGARCSPASATPK
jgi:hypothetical protein